MMIFEGHFRSVNAPYYSRNLMPRYKNVTLNSVDCDGKKDHNISQQHRDPDQIYHIAVYYL